MEDNTPLTPLEHALTEKEVNRHLAQSFIREMQHGAKRAYTTQQQSQRQHQQHSSVNLLRYDRSQRKASPGTSKRGGKEVSHSSSSSCARRNKSLSSSVVAAHHGSENVYPSSSSIATDLSGNEDSSLSAQLRRLWDADEDHTLWKYGCDDILALHARLQKEQEDLERQRMKQQAEADAAAAATFRIENSPRPRPEPLIMVESDEDDNIANNNTADAPDRGVMLDEDDNDDVTQVHQPNNNFPNRQNDGHVGDEEAEVPFDVRTLPSQCTNVSSSLEVIRLPTPKETAPTRPPPSVRPTSAKRTRTPPSTSATAPTKQRAASLRSSSPGGGNKVRFAYGPHTSPTKKKASSETASDKKAEAKEKEEDQVVVTVENKEQGKPDDDGKATAITTQKQQPSPKNKPQKEESATAGTASSSPPVQEDGPSSTSPTHASLNASSSRHEGRKQFRYEPPEQRKVDEGKCCVIQ